VDRTALVVIEHRENAEHLAVLKDERQTERLSLHAGNTELKELAKENRTAILTLAFVMAVHVPVCINVLHHTVSCDACSADEPELKGPRVETDLFNLLAMEKLQRRAVGEWVHASTMANAFAHRNPLP
jgi:hypothetical protein